MNKTKSGYLVTHRTRYSVYTHKGKYKGWVNRRTLNATVKDSEGCVSLVQTRRGLKVKTKAVSLDKAVIYKNKRRRIEIKTYTKTQRRFIVKELKKRRMPLEKPNKWSSILDLKRTFKLYNIQTSKLKSGSP